MSDYGISRGTRGKRRKFPMAPSLNNELEESESTNEGDEQRQRDGFKRHEESSSDLDERRKPNDL